ncbi:SET domain-containing protein [Auriscalpium vulgare]|uniref:SET domain-containing protein n=1 Tax=Auriscalpium vulgare TaxID=40419 RepID=A0ACB8RIS9_9AGAM|nr:SET domain-containing protein [Auriscalpium vulgare]
MSVAHLQISRARCLLATCFSRRPLEAITLRATSMRRGFLKPCSGKTPNARTIANSARPVPIPCPLVRQLDLVPSMKTTEEAFTRALRDPGFNAAWGRIPGTEDGPHAITAGIYTVSAAGSTLLTRSCKPFKRAGGLYEIRDTHVAGRGMFALEGFLPGSLIAHERPLLILSVAEMSPVVAGLPVWKECPGGEHCLVEAAVAAMPEDARRLLLSLVSSRTGPSMTHNITNTNAYTIGNLDGCIGVYGAIFEDMSRVNHSCSPNAEFLWNMDTLTGDVRALRHIAPGEQITTSYVDVFSPYTSRLDTLWRSYTFRCQCPTCTLQPHQIIDDDLFRTEIYNLLDPARRPAVGLCNALHVTKTYLLKARRMERDGFYDACGWVAVARVLVEAASVLGERGRAVRWATRAAEMTRAATGTDGGWAAVAAAPEQTLWWQRGGEVEGGTDRAVWSGPQFSVSQAAM